MHLECAPNSSDRVSRRNGAGRRKGSAIVYTLITMTIFMTFGMLAVDVGHVQMTKCELQNATESAARHAAVGIRTTILSVSGAYANAASVMAANSVDGAPAPFNSATDLSLGIWNSTTRTFTVTTDTTTANAVRLSTKLTLGNSTAHPLTFASYFNRIITVHAVSIATVTGQDATTYVSAKGNPWLSGMPSGTLCTDFRTSSSEMDSAGSGPNVASSPAAITLASLGASAGNTMTFDGVTGSANFGSGSVNSDADGDATKLINLGSPTFGSYSYYTSSMNGMSNCHAPINAMVAVFLGPADPSTTSAPAPLDFSSSAARDFTSLSPQLKQVFFIGDGRRINGEVQQFIVPAGATRVFIANMDGWQYNDNTGGYNLSVHATQTITSVYAN